MYYDYNPHTPAPTKLPSQPHPPTPQASPSKKSNLKAFLHLVSILIAAFIIVLFFEFFVFHPYKVEGNSMSPTLSSGDRLIVLRTNKVISDILGRDYVPKRGEIVVFSHPQPTENRKLIKRVVGLPNERIVIKDNKIFIYNDDYPRGFELDWKFEPALPDFSQHEQVYDRIIREGEIFVLGDNRLPGQSADSRRSLGNIPVENIEGVVIIRILPLNQITFF